MAAGFHQKGDLAGWQDAVFCLADHPRALCALFAGLAPPLLMILGASNFVMDLANRTSTGKTTAQRVAANLWGRPDEKEHGVMGTWDATRVWLEQASAALNGLPLILDDTKRAKNPAMVAELIYTVAQGRGRGTKLSISTSSTWRTVLLGSGETPACSFTQDGEVRTRVLELRGAPFGADNAQARRVMEGLNLGLLDHYGHVGPAYVAWLLKNRDQWPEFVRQYRAVCEYLASGALSAEGSRLAQAFGVLVMAEALAIG